MRDDREERPAKEEPSLAEIGAGIATVLRRLGPGGPLAVIASTLPMVGLLTLAFCFNIIGPWLRAQPVGGPVIYTVGYAVCAGLAIFPTHIQAALGGWSFGFALGFPLALGGIGGAALLGYAIALRATGDRALQLIDERPRLRAVYRTLLGSGFWRSLLIVTLIRAAVSPFALTNFVLAATRVNLTAYVVGTVVGIAPRTAAAVFLAVGLQDVTSKSPHRWWLWLIGAVLTILAVIVINQWANKAIVRVTAVHKEP